MLIYALIYILLFSIFAYLFGRKKHTQSYWKIPFKKSIMWDFWRNIFKFLESRPVSMQFQHDEDDLATPTTSHLEESQRTLKRLSVPGQENGQLHPGIGLKLGLAW